MKRSSPRTASLAAGAAVAGLLLLAPACNIMGPALYYTLGPEKVPPAFVLDKERPTLVLVDDPGSRVPEQVIRRQISRVAEQMLLDEKVVTKVIAGESAAAVLSRERFGQPLGIVEVGRAVGAETVVYVLVEQFTLQGQPGVYSPTAKIRVKVMDVASKTRLWPTGDPGSAGLAVELPLRQGPAPSSTTEITLAENGLAEAVGKAIAHLFYEHPADQTGEKLETRAKEQRG